MPSITDRAVLTSRRFLASAALQGEAEHGVTSGAEPLERRRGSRHRRTVDLVDDAAVGEEHDPVGVARRAGRGSPSRPSGRSRRRRRGSSRAARSPTSSRGCRSARRRRSARAGSPSPGGGDPLLLAAGQLRRAVAEPVGDAEGATSAPAMPASGAAAGEGQRQRDVLLGGQRRDQVERLEHEADRSRRSTVSCLSFRVVRSVSPMNTLPT